MKTAEVYIRARPLAKREKDKKFRECLEIKENSIKIDNKITFDYAKKIIGPNINQTETYSLAGISKMIDDFIYEGTNASLIAYGQTGSGKTHTLIGDGVTRDEIRKAYGLNVKYNQTKDNLKKDINMKQVVTNDFSYNKVDANELPSGWGIFPRALLEILQKTQSQIDSEELILTVSCIELYNFQCFDLLNAKNQVFITSKGDVDFTFFKHMKIMDIEDIQNIVEIVFTERQSRTTKMNDTSSRSHCIVTIQLSKITIQDGEKSLVSSILQIADLCGSERTDKTGLEGQEIKTTFHGMESICINWELWQLGYLVETKTNPNKKLDNSALPSVLVKAIQSCLTGEAVVKVFINLSPSIDCAKETKFSCEFGYKFSLHKIKPSQSSCVKIKDAIINNYKVLKENWDGLKSLENSVSGKKNPMYSKRKSKVLQLCIYIEFLEKCLNPNYIQDGLLLEISSKGNHIQQAPTNNFKFKKPSIFDYKLKNNWDNRCRMVAVLTNESYSKNKKKPSYQQNKANFDSLFINMAKNKRVIKSNNTQQISEIRIDCTKFDCNNSNTNLVVYVHKLINQFESNKKQIPIVYYHGGGAVYLSAKLYQPFLAKYLDMLKEHNINVVLFNVEYRLAPEHKAPRGILDGYCALKYIYDNADSLNIDKSKIIVTGESGGGYITTGVCNHASKLNQSHMIKLSVPVIPMTSNLWYTSENLFSMEKQICKGQQEMIGWLSESNVKVDDTNLFPNEMDESTANNWPNAVVMTSEYDIYRRASEELAAKLDKHNKLVDWCVHPGVTHGWYFDFDHPTAYLFYKDFKKIVEKYVLFDI